MLRCDRCGEMFDSEMIFLNDRGEFRCGFCLGFFNQHPFPGTESDVNCDTMDSPAWL